MPRETAGALTLKAKADNTKYDAREVGEAIVDVDGVAKELLECAHRHRNIFDEDEYFVGYVIASDPLIQGVMRKKFYADLYLPSPRPEQAMFLYNKPKDQFTHRLWVLPAAYSENSDAWTMEKLYLATDVPKAYKTMKTWTHAFYDGYFWKQIRKETGKNFLSLYEFLEVNRDKLAHTTTDQVDTSLAETFDFSKVTMGQVKDTEQVVTEKDILNGTGQA